MLTLSNGHSFEVACASGALAYNGRGWWWERYGLVPLGLIKPAAFTIITKTLTLLPRKGNLKWWCPWRCVRRLGGGNYVNAVDLTNQGLPWWQLRGSRKLVAPTIVSIAPTDYMEAVILGSGVKRAGVVGIEVNVSCPNVRHDREDWVDRTVKLVEAVAGVTDLPVGVKLGWTDPFVELAERIKGVIEWVDLINAVPWGVVYPDKKSPLDKYGLVGAVSGPAIQTHARRALHMMHASGVGVPVLSGGGIDSHGEALHRIRSGAAAVSLGTLFLSKPSLPNEIALRLGSRDLTIS